MMTDLARYYEEQEPVDVFRFAGRTRAFVAYDQSLIVDLAGRAASGERAADLYVEVCEMVLRRDPRVAALPPDSPRWEATDGKWRPISDG
jgi:hypothetical protein